MDLPSLSRDQVRAVDRVAIERHGVPGPVLMENAGLLASLELLPLVRPGGAPVWLLAGGGNNGGDALVVARQLDLRGLPVRVLATTPKERLSGDAALQRRIVDSLGIEVREATTEDRVAAWLPELSGAALLVDGLLGTGARGTPREPLRGLLHALGAGRVPGGPPVAALDLPSGLDADLGRPLDPEAGCVRADLTLTFVARKRGFDVPGSEAWTGAVRVLPIGVPARVVRAVLGDAD